MARKYNCYYFKNPINVWIGPTNGLESNQEDDTIIIDDFETSDGSESNPNPPAETQPGFNFLGIRLEETLYKDNDLRRLLGMQIKETISRVFPGTSLQTINTFSDSSRLGITGVLGITLKAVNRGDVYPAWGETYKTQLIYDLNKPYI